MPPRREVGAPTVAASANYGCSLGHLRLQVVRVDRRWLDAMLARNPLALAAAAEVPVFCNQWGVKR